MAVLVAVDILPVSLAFSARAGWAEVSWEADAAAPVASGRALYASNTSY
ncbi:MAG: hypothetical protein ACETWG_11870 [Candidatus Neomarinimicrobiota bacterium]